MIFDSNIDFFSLAEIYLTTNLWACHSGNFFLGVLSNISCKFATQHSITIYVFNCHTKVKGKPFLISTVLGIHIKIVK